jgi:hypothetical protein
MVIGADMVESRVTVERPLRGPSLVEAMLLITALKVLLSTFGFERTWSWIQQRAGWVPRLNEVNLAAVSRAEYKLAMAAALYPGRAACLERSLTLYWYLRRHGVGVDFRMGVQMYPFLAHAWLELDGRAINDVPEHVRRFVPITVRTP